MIKINLDNTEEVKRVLAENKHIHVHTSIAANAVVFFHSSEEILTTCLCCLQYKPQLKEIETSVCAECIYNETLKEQTKE